MKRPGSRAVVVVMAPIASAQPFDSAALASLRAQDWGAWDAQLGALCAAAPENPLLAWYSERLAQLRVLPYQPDWDGATRFDTK